MEPVQLTKEHLDALQNLGADLDLIQREINRMTEAGLDATSIQKQFDEMRKVREGLLRVYGGVTRRRTVG